MRGATVIGHVLAVATVPVMLAGCATLQSIAALRRVDFSIERVSNASLAGVGIDRIRDYQDLSAIEIARVGTALARGELPFRFDLHLTALNPADNNVAARLLEMDWTLLLDDRETVSGTIEREFVLEPGIPTDIPVPISLDLARFFEEDARDMIDLALAVAGAGGEPQRVSIRALPTVQTALGPIRYPEPIVIVSGEIGG